MRMADMLDMKRASVERVTCEYVDGTSELSLVRKLEPIKCEYCGVNSLELKSNCNSCGAGLPLPALFYGSPGQMIPVDLSILKDNAPLHYYIYSFLQNGMRLIGGATEFKV